MWQGALCCPAPSLGETHLPEKLPLVTRGRWGSSSCTSTRHIPAAKPDLHAWSCVVTATVRMLGRRCGRPGKRLKEGKPEAGPLEAGEMKGRRPPSEPRKAHPPGFLLIQSYACRSQEACFPSQETVLCFNRDEKVRGLCGFKKTAIAQQYGCPYCRRMVKMANFMLCAFYHNLKNLNNKNAKIISIYPTLNEME